MPFIHFHEIRFIKMNVRRVLVQIKLAKFSEIFLWVLGRKWTMTHLGTWQEVNFDLNDLFPALNPSTAYAYRTWVTFFKSETVSLRQGQCSTLQTTPNSNSSIKLQWPTLHVFTCSIVTLRHEAIPQQYYKIIANKNMFKLVCVYHHSISLLNVLLIMTPVSICVY